MSGKFHDVNVKAIAFARCPSGHSGPLNGIYGVVYTSGLHQPEHLYFCVGVYVILQYTAKPLVSSGVSGEVMKINSRNSKLYRKRMRMNFIRDQLIELTNNPEFRLNWKIVFLIGSMT